MNMDTDLRHQMVYLYIFPHVFFADGSRIEELEFMWYPDNPVQNNTKLRLPEFKFTKTVPQNCTKAYSKGNIQ